MKTDGRTVDFDFCGISLKLGNTAEKTWRLIFQGKNGFDLFGAAQTLSKDLKEDVNNDFLPVNVVENGMGIKICSADGTSVCVDNNSIGFYDASGILRRSINKISKKRAGTVIKISLSKTEKLFGTGERFNRVNQRGQRIHIYAIDQWCRKHGNSYVPVPFVLTSECVGIYMNRFEHSVFDLGKRDKSTLTIEQMYCAPDLYFFIEDTPQKVLNDYSKITGFAPMPPEWAFGTLVCRYHPEFGSVEGILQMTREMEKNDFPWEAVITEGWPTYNKTRWSDLKEVSKQIHALGKKMMVYEGCGKFPGNCEEYFGLCDDHAVNSDKGTLLRQTRSMNLLDNFHRKKMRCVDLTSEKSLNKWQEIWNALVYDIGVDGAKIDFCEQFPDKPIIHFSDGRDPMAAHHWYPVFYNIIRHTHFSSLPGGGMNLSRGGGIGAQRYPFIWAGDQRREFNFLGAVLKAALSSGLTGIPFVTWDMAGYQPAWLPYDRRHENLVFMRGVEMTAFCLTVQTHGNVKRPYDFDEHTRAVYRAYTKLHDALRPYILEQSKFAAETGVPVMRNLFLYDPLDKKAAEVEDEFMLGCGLLAAPVLNRKKKRNIYLPAGEWVNIFDGKEYSGKTVLKDYAVPYEMIPVFRLKNVSSNSLDEALKAAADYIYEINMLSVND